MHLQSHWTYKVCNSKGRTTHACSFLGVPLFTLAERDTKRNNDILGGLPMAREHIGSSSCGFLSFLESGNPESPLYGCKKEFGFYILNTFRLARWLTSPWAHVVFNGRTALKGVEQPTSTCPDKWLDHLKLSPPLRAKHPQPEGRKEQIQCIFSWYVKMGRCFALVDST